MTALKRPLADRLIAPRARLPRSRGCERAFRRGSRGAPTPFVVVWLVIVGSAAGFPTPVSSQQAQIAEAVLRTFASLSAGDAETLRGEYAPGALIFVESDSLLELDVDEWLALGGGTEWMPGEIETQVLGATAVTVARVTGALRLPNGTMLQGAFRYSETRVRSGAAWRILQQQLSPLDQAVASALGPAAADAQVTSADSLRAELRLPVPRVPQSTQLAYRPIPAMGANSPTGWGAQWGDVFVGAALQVRARNVDAHDGVVGAGFGLGNAETLVGLEVSVISFSTFRSGWGNRMGVDLKLHRAFPGRFGLAVGWEGALIRGETDGLRSGYAALSRWFVLRPDPRTPFSALVLSVGGGNGRFQDPEAWAAGDRGIGVFGSMALRVLEPVSVIADWTGQDLMLAASIAPLRSHSVVVSVGVADLTGSAGGRSRAIASTSYAYRFD